MSFNAFIERDVFPIYFSLSVIHSATHSIKMKEFNMAVTKTIPTNSQQVFHHPLSLGQNFGNKHLTKREAQVLKYIILGYTAKRIGQELDISFRTVESYIEIIKMKLDCASKGQIAETIIKSGLILELGLF